MGKKGVNSLVYLLFFYGLGTVLGKAETNDILCLYENTMLTAQNIHDQCRKWCPTLNTCYEPCVAGITKDMVNVSRRKSGNKEPTRKRKIQLNTGCVYDNTVWTARLIYDQCRSWCPQLNTCYESCVQDLSKSLIKSARRSEKRKRRRNSSKRKSS